MLLAVIFLLGQLVNPQPAMAGDGSAQKNEGETPTKQEDHEEKTVAATLKGKPKDAAVPQQVKADNVIAGDHLQQLIISIAVATGKGPEMLMGL
jgi:hypothetical protein